MTVKLETLVQRNCLNCPIHGFECKRCWVEHTTFAARMEEDPGLIPGFFPSGMLRILPTNVQRSCYTSLSPICRQIAIAFYKGSPAECLGVGSMSSFVFDYVARQKVGGTNLGGYIVEQLPVLPRGKP